MPGECEIISSRRPAAGSGRPRATCALKAASPTAVISSTRYQSKAMPIDMPKASRARMPRGIGAHRHVHELAELGEVLDVGDERVGIHAVDPRDEADVLRAGQVGVEAAARSRAARRSSACRRISPASGCTVPAIMPSSVDLPAPLRPSTPTLAPRGRARLRSVEHHLPPASGCGRTWRRGGTRSSAADHRRRGITRRPAGPGGSAVVPHIVVDQHQRCPSRAAGTAAASPESSARRG